jgi:surface-anchored protein
MNSRDGIATNDSVVLTAGGHRHVSWAFSMPGTYEVDFEAAGTLATNNQFTASGPVTYTFHVVSASSPCFRFTQEHVDLLSFVWNAESNSLALMASDDTHGGTLYTSNQCVVIAPESTRFALPAGTPFGKEGDPLWILPQNPYPGVPYVGVSAERLPAGSFNDPLTIQLKRVEGPGQFIVWQATSFGSFDIKMDTRDGIGPNDKLTPFVGGHEHYNWGFTASVVYRVYFQALGIRPGQITNTLSPETFFTFYVLPLKPFEVWQTNNFAGQLDPANIGPDADPDHDGIVNAMEYALNLNPNFKDRNGLPFGSIISTNGHNYSAITYTRTKAATDCLYSVVAASSITATNWEVLNIVHRVENLGVVDRITVCDIVPVNSQIQRFYRLQVRLP